jgi:hypothetical protein
MSKENSYYNPIAEDENFFRYQKLVDYCHNYIQDLETVKAEEVYVMIAYLARSVYEVGYSDGLVADVLEGDKIYN